MKKNLLILLVLLAGCSKSGELTLFTDHMEIRVNGKGRISSMVDRREGTQYLAGEADAPLLSVMVDSQVMTPVNAVFQADGVIALRFPDSLEATVGYNEEQSYITFELLSLHGNADLVIWGPYPTSISKVIGETVGVVRGDKFAIGLQALNPKTLGGYPWNENDCMPQIDIFDQDDPSDISEKGKRYVLYRVEAAKPTAYGSSLQAYCRNRLTEREVENLGYERYLVPELDDGGVVGSGIALFGCPTEMALSTIGEIEVGEGLPHPMIDGEWGKMQPSASAAYIILDFGEEDIDRAIDVTRKAGLRYLYHSGPFSTWGHFELRKDQFPNGTGGFRKCVERAAEEGIYVGAHTLSNFITTNDLYVTPVPDKRLARVGFAHLAGDIDSRQKVISVDSPGLLRDLKNSNLRTVRIGNELVRIGSLDESEGYRLVDCERGAFNTGPSPHQSGEEVSLLADHGYKVFLTDPELSVEVAENIASFFNSTGTRQISFDGLEGNRSTGMGNYGEILFTTSWYNAIDEKVKEHYIADASRTSHYFWHIYTRMNWGEPWYAGFRESQTEYRLRNQPYFQRNMMPGMLGWFRMTSSTSVEDIEWMLARSAAFNAGYAFVVDYSSLEKNGKSDEILGLIGLWEKARMSGIFTPEQRLRMEDLNNEFHLESPEEGQFNLKEVVSYKFRHENVERQPGEPLFSSWELDNQAGEQLINFLITAGKGSSDKFTIEIDNHRTLFLERALREGECIKYNGGPFAIVYDQGWNKIGEVGVEEDALMVKPGSHNLNFGCRFGPGDGGMVKVEFRLVKELN